MADDFRALLDGEIDSEEYVRRLTERIREERVFNGLAAPVLKAEAEIHRLREALAFYADEGNWEPRLLGSVRTPSIADVDRGARAREALKEDVSARSGRTGGK